MRTGRQFTSTLSPGQTRSYFTHSWPANWHVVWYCQPTSIRSGGPQIDWEIGVERASSSLVTYWIKAKNLTNSTVNFEGRYAIFNA
jgi:hypothetical protein